MDYKIFPISENALTIDFGNIISVELNERVLELADIIERNKFPGFIEIVPAYSSLTIFYDFLRIHKNNSTFLTAFEFVRDWLEQNIKRLSTVKFSLHQLIKIPVDYSEDLAPDLDFVAQTADLSKEEVINIHTSTVYRVFMVGFLPAFAYMGEVDMRIATPRKQIPRKKIEKGSVGIAGKQTGIYPLESPGGWQIIGKTGLELFRPNKNEISLLKTGDQVQFYDINAK